jgi:hypothetical protein
MFAVMKHGWFAAACADGGLTQRTIADGLVSTAIDYCALAAVPMAGKAFIWIWFHMKSR